MEREKIIAVAGADKRSQAMKAALQAMGYQTVSLDERDKALAAVLPMPYTLDGKTVKDTDLSLEELFGSLGKHFVILGGRLDAKAYCLAMKNGIRLFDYYDQEAVKIKNAALTADGTMAMVPVDLGIQLCNARVLVCGFGRTGKALANRLRGAGAAVSVSARKDTDLAWIEALGYTAMSFEKLDVSEFDVVMNTVPARILTKKHIACMKKNAAIIDLASAPFGTDFDAAKEYGITALTAPSLPARVFPDKAGAVLAQSAAGLLKEAGCGI
ncbi:MAG: hypothetical protein HFE78_01885 [Clostridiales bacterium]|nr:hypothetical protein [Clostridiales bacterium]